MCKTFRLSPACFICDAPQYITIWQSKTGSVRARTLASQFGMECAEYICARYFRVI